MPGFDLESWVSVHCPETSFAGLASLPPSAAKRRPRKGGAGGGSSSDFWSGIAYNYVIRCDPAVAGRDGHRATIRVANILIVGFNLSKSAALPIFQAWNQSCQPPWSEFDLKHKLDEAIEFRDSHANPGYLRTNLRRKSKRAS